MLALSSESAFAVAQPEIIVMMLTRPAMNYIHPFFHPACAAATLFILISTQTPVLAQTPPGTVIYTCDFTSDLFHSTDPQVKLWANAPDKVSLDKDTGHLTKGSVKLTNSEMGKNVAVYGPFVPYTGPTIHVSVEIKQDSVVAGTNKPAICVYYYDQDRKPLALPWNLYHDQTTLPDGSTDWTTYEESYTFPSGSPPPSFVRVVVNLNGTGTVWFDKSVLSMP